MDRWCGRVALVTGASSGIGAAVAEKLTRNGMKVVGCARNTQTIEALRDTLAKESCPGSVFPVKCDLSQESEILAMFETIKEKFGGVDVCVNNAGVGFAGNTVTDGPTHEWETMLKVNVLACSIVARETLRSMKSRGVDDGHLVYINSDSGLYIGDDPDWHFYEGTKFAARAHVEGMRKDLRKMNSHIRVSMICPGCVETEFFKRAGGDDFHSEVFQEGAKYLQPQDLADSVAFVLSAPPHVQIFQMTMFSTEEPSF